MGGYLHSSCTHKPIPIPKNTAQTIFVFLLFPFLRSIPCPRGILKAMFCKGVRLIRHRSASTLMPSAISSEPSTPTRRNKCSPKVTAKVRSRSTLWKYSDMRTGSHSAAALHMRNTTASFGRAKYSCCTEASALNCVRTPGIPLPGVCSTTWALKFKTACSRHPAPYLVPKVL